MIRKLVNQIQGRDKKIIKRVVEVLKCVLEDRDFIVV